jgi:hypothetical protein
MRVQHVAQAARGWPDGTQSDRQAGARLAETIERTRWRLWHGQVRRALDLIDETLAASYDTVSTITLNDGPRVTENDVLPTSASHPLYEAVT